MKFREFTDGLSTTVAVDEIRAGISDLDPRGTWALGQVGSSVTARHGMTGDAGIPNSDHRTSDDIIGCMALVKSLGAGALGLARMPCYSADNSSEIEINSQATARSMHPSGVQVLMVGGNVQFIHDDVDPQVWHAIHTRESADNMGALQ